MNILYLGRYKQRFKPIIDDIQKLPAGSRILELCFGDTEIAQFCRQHGYIWKGFDLNDQFVKQAQKAGFDARVEDLTAIESLPECDLCIIVGSLYHFHPNTESLLSKMFKASNQVILSEPVINLSSAGGIIGFIARRSANAGKGDENFRYTKSTLEEMLNRYCEKFNCKVVSLLALGKDLIIKLEKQ